MAIVVYVATIDFLLLLVDMIDCPLAGPTGGPRSSFVTYSSILFPESWHLRFVAVIQQQIACRESYPWNYIVGFKSFVTVYCKSTSTKPSIRF